MDDKFRKPEPDLLRPTVAIGPSPWTNALRP